MPQSMKLRSSKTATILEANRIEPKLGAHVLPFDVNMWRLMSIRRVKEKPVSSRPEYRWHHLPIYIAIPDNSSTGLACAGGWNDVGARSRTPGIVKPCQTPGRAGGYGNELGRVKTPRPASFRLAVETRIFNAVLRCSSRQISSSAASAGFSI